MLVIAAQWYARGGREFLFGTKPEEEIPGVLDTFKLWISVPPGAPFAAGKLDMEVRNPEGETVGRIFEARDKVSTNVSGRPVEHLEVHGEFERAKLGYPINVAVAQAESYTLAAVEAS